jgi:two-component system, OmpR family, sensor histidine kinase KdpD
MGTVPRPVTGSIVGVAAALVAGAVMFPVRSHLAVATAGLVLALPVVAGVAVGGFVAGLTSVVASFLVYDIAFTPPFGTLTVGSLQNWAALGVYAVVLAVVAPLTSHLREAQEAAQSRESSARHLLDLSELLLPESPDLGRTIVTAVHHAFGIEGVTLLEPEHGRLEVVASAGTALSAGELARIRSESHLPVSLSLGGSADMVQTLVLASSGRPVGMLVLRNAPATRAVREALPILANHLAVALERTDLRARMHRTEFLEEVDRLRQALVGAVSHDLRSPLATIKVASSTLNQSSEVLSPDDRHELYELIDAQTDRLTRLVNNLLDMTRIQSGSLEVRPMPTRVADLVDEAVTGLRSELGERPIKVQVPEGVPLVDADPLLIVQVLANLLENANRHGPPGTPVIVDVTATPGGRVTVAVEDEGGGVPEAERQAVFETFVRFDTGGRSGLGLAIAKAFVEAHGDRIWVEDAPDGGARFVFTLPAAPRRPAPSS